MKHSTVSPDKAEGPQFQRTQRLGVTPLEEIAKLSVLVPIYDERFTIKELLRRVLAVPLDVALEIVVVDDGSTDGSWDIVQRLAESESRIIPVRHAENRGKGAAVRTAIEHMSGDVAVIQDADLEYNPSEYRRLLEPILDGRADAVFGSRFTGESRRVLLFWHSLANRLLTTLSNMANDVNLTDMETCYKMVRADVLRNLNLKANSFTIEPELTARLSQWGARIYEVPITYAGRTRDEGKKIRGRDAIKAAWAILRCRFFDTQFTVHPGFYILTAAAKANRYNRYVLRKLSRFIGSRLLEAGAGIGNLSHLLLDRDRLILVDSEPLYVARLRQRFGHLEHVSVQQADVTSPGHIQTWKDEQIDSIFSSNVLEHIEDDVAVLKTFHEVLTPGGHCVIVVPAGAKLYTAVDAALGHYRRYGAEELRGKMAAAGFEIVHSERFNKVGSIAWAVSGKLLRRKRLSPTQMIWFDRLLWLTRLLEPVLPVPGMSLIVVGRKSTT